MTDFISIKEAMAAKKGSIVATVSLIGDLKAGSKDGKDWTRKSISLTDSTGQVYLTAWNKEIDLFEYGGSYQIENGWWREHNGVVGLSLGNYAQVTKITNGSVSSTPEKVVEVSVEQFQSRMPLPIMNENFKITVEDQTIKLLQIESLVTFTFKKFMPDKVISPQQLGMYVKEIYRMTNRITFSKGGDAFDEGVK